MAQKKTNVGRTASAAADTGRSQAPATVEVALPEDAARPMAAPTLGGMTYRQGVGSSGMKEAPLDLAQPALIYGG